MDTKQFLEAVLPTEGLYCLATPDPSKGGGFGHTFKQSIADLPQLIAHIDNNGRNAYFAMSSFVEKGSRKQANVKWVRSFWLDIDTQEGKPKETYATRKEAVAALTDFCGEVGLPLPMIVSSGYGIHAYWSLTSNITEPEWKETATLLKAATRLTELAVDQSRTSDSASILRPAGSHNHKNGLAKIVKVASQPITLTHEQFHNTLENYLTERGAMPNMPTAKVDNINSDLMVVKQFDPSDAEVIANHCGVIASMRDTKGNIDQPTWYGCIGVLGKTIQGAEIIHEWSNGYKGYSKGETDAKIAQAEQYGATLCQKLRDSNEAICSSCVHWGKIKSPITLGTERGQPQIIQSHPDAGKSTAPQAFIHSFPLNFGWGKLDDQGKTSYIWQLTRMKVEDDAGGQLYVDKKIPITDTLFYPIERIRDSSGQHQMIMQVDRKDGTKDEFIIDNGLVIDGKDLQKELARREIVVAGDTDKELKLYLKGWINHLRDTRHITPATKQFGWSGDEGFVYGDKLYTADGPRKAVTVGSALSYANWMKPSGNLDEWVDIVDRLFGQHGLEPQQFLILASFAAPLFSMLKVGGGVVVYAHCVAGGHGKSTAQRAGMSVWANSEGGIVLGNGQFSVNGLYDHMGVLCNLPIVIDEMGECAPEFASQFVYSASDGAGKKRLNKDLTQKETLDWSTIANGSGNKLLSEKITSINSDATAMLMRLWEFTIPATQKFSINVNDASDLTFRLKSLYGLAGPVYADYIARNKEAVMEMLLQTRRDFVTKNNITPRERFWSALHACILTALNITRELGLIHFDYGRMERWIGAELAKQRGQVVYSIASPVEQFSKMVSDLFKGMLVTEGEGNLHPKVGWSANVVQDPFGPAVIGRHILPYNDGKNVSAERMFISVSSVREWCRKNNSSWNIIESEMVNADIIQHEEERIALGRGVRKYSGVTGSVRCISVDLNKLRSTGVLTQLATPLQAVPLTPQPPTALDPTGTV